jgi:glycosyltransferase involved in cell wall biosynthesis
MSAPFQPAAPGQLRLGIFATHPIQYFAPFWRLLAATPGLDVKVHFFNDQSVRGGKDAGFGVAVAWDVPLLEGYGHEFITRDGNLRDKNTIELPDARTRVTREHFDVVMVQGYAGKFERQVIAAAKANGVGTVMRAEFTDASEAPRGFAKRMVRDAMLQRLYAKVDCFGVIGKAAERHLRRLGVAQDKLFSSPYAVDTALFERQRAEHPRAAARAALGLREEDFVVLFSGKLIPRKAPLLLIAALEKLRGRESVVLLMVGDGEQRAAVEEKGRALLGERLRLEGFVNQSGLGQRYAAADVLVLPSTFETWGLVVNEAMQFGVPAIVSANVGSGEDLVVEGKTGMVFPVGEAAALAACLQTLVDEPARAREMGAAARAHVAGYSTEAAVEGIRRALGVG